MEIYSYNPPDALACVEHKRHEIVHRKHFHADAHQSPDAFPPLIATIENDTMGSNFRTGFCILFTSDVYRDGPCNQDDNQSSGP